MDRSHKPRQPLKTPEMEAEDRKRKILIVLENQNGEYWKVLKEEIEKLIDHEDKFLDSFKNTGINSNVLEKFNLATERRETLRQMLRLNEIVTYEHKSWIDGVIKPLKETFQYVKTFVGAGFTEGMRHG